MAAPSHSNAMDFQLLFAGCSTNFSRTRAERKKQVCYRPRRGRGHVPKTCRPVLLVARTSNLSPARKHGRGAVAARPTIKHGPPAPTRRGKKHFQTAFQSFRPGKIAAPGMWRPRHEKDAVIAFQKVQTCRGYTTNGDGETYGRVFLVFPSDRVSAGQNRLVAGPKRIARQKYCPGKAGFRRIRQARLPAHQGWGNRIRRQGPAQLPTANLPSAQGC